jgi:hypothetical protein
VFLDIARANRVSTGFLEAQKAVWQRPECNTDAGSTNPTCILPALDAILQPTSFAEDVTAFESGFEAWTGIDIALPMLKTASAWSLFQNGVVNSPPRSSSGWPSVSRSARASGSCDGPCEALRSRCNPRR